MQGVQGAGAVWLQRFATDPALPCSVLALPSSPLIRFLCTEPPSEPTFQQRLVPEELDVLHAVERLVCAVHLVPLKMHRRLVLQRVIMRELCPHAVPCAIVVDRHRRATLAEALKNAHA